MNSIASRGSSSDSRARAPHVRRGLACLVGIGCSFGGGGRAPAGEPAAAPWRSSPPVRVTGGFDPWLSPGGTRLAFRRSIRNLEKRDARGQPIQETVLHIRDLADGAERRAVRDGRVSGWAGDDLVVLDHGGSVRVGGAGDQPKFPSPHNGLWPRPIGRSPSGRVLAYALDSDFAKASVAGERRIPSESIYVVSDVGGVKELEVGDGPDSRGSEGFLAISPDDIHLAFHMTFMDRGQLPHPRVGVVDLATGTATFVLDEAYGSAGPHDAATWQAGASGGNVWDGRGERFVFVRTVGDVARDLYVCTADGKDLRRLTTDGDWKAAPCLSADGDRCAFWTQRQVPPHGDRAPSGRERGAPEANRIEVLFLRTGERIELPVPGEGGGANLQWSRDGGSLWFEWSASGATAIWRVEAPPAPAVPTATPVIDRALAPVEELLLDLRGPDETAVEATIREASTFDDPRVTQALRDVLRRWVRSDYRPYPVIDALQARGAVCAIPELLEELARGEWTDAVTPALLKWRVEAAVPMWRRLVLSGPPSSRGTAVVALAQMGEPDGWDLVATAARGPDKETRARVCGALSRSRDPRAVDVLISLLKDDTALYADSPSRGQQVGDDAEAALHRLTGQAFDRDATAWAAWWEKAEHKLPDPSSPAPATDDGGREPK